MAHALADSVDSSKSPRWFSSAGFDLAFFHVPIWLCWLVVFFVMPSSLRKAQLPLWAWVSIVLLVDVGHVWSTLYRTYFEKSSRAANRDILTWIPLSCFVVAFGLSYLSMELFWRVLAYIAVFHFIKQQYGITALYHAKLFQDVKQLPEERRGGALKFLQRLRVLDKVAIYIATGFPLVVWHMRLPRKICWFSQGDFLPHLGSLYNLQASAAGSVVLQGLIALFQAIWIVSIAVWIGAHLTYIRRYGRAMPWGKLFWVLGTYANWYIGIVHFDSSFVFTLTNVIAHGIPYYGLVYLYTENSWRKKKQSWRPFLARRVVMIALFATPILLCAFWEEYLWDLLIHNREHSQFYSLFVAYPLQAVTTPAWQAFWVALLSVPQAAHYVLDGFLWKANRRNPELKENLGLV